MTPVWNEIWRVKRVPVTADLHVEIFDKDVGAPHDDYIGKFKTSVSPGAKEAEIEGPLFRRDRGTFWLKVGPLHRLILATDMFADRLETIEAKLESSVVCLRRPRTVFEALLSYHWATH